MLCLKTTSVTNNCCPGVLVYINVNLYYFKLVGDEIEVALN